MVDVGIAPARVVTARSYATEREGTQVVGSSYIELFAEWGYTAVAIGIYGSGNKAGGEGVACREVVVATGLDGAFDELGEGGAEKSLPALAELMPSGGIDE